MPYMALKVVKKITNKTKVFTTVGLAAARLKAEMRFVDDDREGLPSLAEIQDWTYNFTTRKLIFVAKAGFDVNVTDNFGFRIYGDWKNLSRLKPLAQKGDVKIHMRDAVGGGFGIFWVVS